MPLPFTPAWRAMRQAKKQASANTPTPPIRMNPTIPKNPFASKTIWGAIIAAISLVGRIVGLDVPEQEITDTIDILSANWTTIADTISIVLVIWGRFTARQPLGIPAAG